MLNILFAAVGWGRLLCLRVGFVASALSTLAFVVPWGGATWLLACAFANGVATDVLWCSLYIYLCERFPTTVRSTGFGVALGIGRTGGVVSSALGGLISSTRVAFACYTAAYAVGAAVALSPSQVESRGRSLADTVA